VVGCSGCLHRQHVFVPLRPTPCNDPPSNHLTTNMPFEFTFHIPHSLNPFAVSPVPSAPLPEVEPDLLTNVQRQRIVSMNRRKLPPRPTRVFSSDPFPEPSPLVRKRGYGSPPNSCGETTGHELGGEGGYVQVAKEETDDYPPQKKRRITDSILSTALNAAIFGTAVGLTAYRLWKGTTLESPSEVPAEQPPPYEEVELKDRAAFSLPPPTSTNSLKIHTALTNIEPPASPSASTTSSRRSSRTTLPRKRVSTRRALPRVRSKLHVPQLRPSSPVATPPPPLYLLTPPPPSLMNSKLSRARSRMRWIG